MILWFGAWIDQNDTHLAKARSEAIRKVKLAFEADDIVREIAPQPKSAKRTKKPAKPVDDPEQDVSPNREIEQKVAEENDRNRNDLLDAATPQEVEEIGT